MTRLSGFPEAVAFLLTFAGLTAWTFSARAEDFTFEVPLELVATPFNGARISCGVYGTVDGKTNLIGGGYRDIFAYQIVDGSYNGVVEIAFNAKSGMQPALAERYSCSLLVAIPGGSSYVQTNDVEALMKPDGLYPKDPQAPFRVSAYGPIPKPSVRPMKERPPRFRLQDGGG